MLQLLLRSHATVTDRAALRIDLVKRGLAMALLVPQHLFGEQCRSLGCIFIHLLLLLQRLLIEYRCVIVRDLCIGFNRIEHL